MNDEQRKKLYAEAAKASNDRKLKEKLEKQRERSIRSAEYHFKKKELVDQKRRKLEEKKEESRRMRLSAQTLLRIFRRWARQLNERHFDEEWMEEFRPKFIEDLNEEVESLEVYLNSQLYKSNVPYTFC